MKGIIRLDKPQIVTMYNKKGAANAFAKLSKC